MAEMGNGKGEKGIQYKDRGKSSCDFGYVLSLSQGPGFLIFLPSFLIFS